MIRVFDGLIKHSTIALKAAVAPLNWRGKCFRLCSLLICAMAPEKSLPKQEKENHSEDGIKIIYFGRKGGHKDSGMERFTTGTRLFRAGRHPADIGRLFLLP